eukprot:TRINITY_DN6348_c0_g1_i9.p2 TRINITY_DN6348_c0_g1~~TRINITY_DN6348_c0_g1_i9.p2  ORF type:complete len:146 (-),score=47.08 TRINITY_DN6348_c0_g1_i9:214-651(-)
MCIRDRSTWGNALIISGAERQSLIQTLLDKANQESYVTNGYIMNGLNDDSKIAVNQDLDDIYFGNLISIFTERPSDFAKKFFYAMKPRHDNLEQLLARMRDVLGRTPEHLDLLTKNLKDEIDKLERRIRVISYGKSEKTDIQVKP